MIPKLAFFCVALLCLPLPAGAATYPVGPGQPYEGIGDVPWESLGAGDLVLIHWRQEPYREKWVIAVQGTAQQPFTVRGVPNHNGEPPVVDGRDATTRASIDFWNEERGVVKIGGANQPAIDEPSWIVVENLDIRSGRPPYQFTGRNGATAYRENAASLYVESGRNITIRNCILRDSGNGLFISHASRNILIEGCWIYDNGIENSIYEHNTYTAAIGIVYQFNRFGPLRANCLGNNLKDRSAGLVVRYNWIESGNRQLDLVDAEDSTDLVEHPSYRQTFVYGNVLIETEGAGNSQVLHYGGDSGNTGIYRKGTLYFYNNTVISKRSDNTTLFRLSTDDERCDCRNNIVWTTAPGTRLALIDQDGAVDLRNNWLKSGWVASHGSFSGIIQDSGGNLAGGGPGFVDAAPDNYHLAERSPCVNAGTTVDAEAKPVAHQYIEHRLRAVRPSDGAIDLGAFEFRKSPSLPHLWLLID